MNRQNGVVGRGALAGLVAAFVLVVWFLVIDLIRGAPFQSPAFLASALFNASPDTVGTGLIALYTVLHFAVFLMLGILAAVVLVRVGIRASFLLGIVFGLLLFDLFFYLSVLVTGSNVTLALGWPAVLIGSVLAGISLMFTLRMTGVAPGVSVGGLLGRHRIVHDGVIGGLIGAGIVAVWFLVYDLLFREAFFTPAALGSALLLGASGPAEIQINVATVLGYSILHVSAFLVGGIVAAAFWVNAERYPPLILGFILVFTAFSAAIMGVITLFASWILPLLGWWAILIGSILGAAGVIGYLSARHPAVIDRLRQTHSIEEIQ